MEQSTWYYRGMSAADLSDNEIVLDPSASFFKEHRALFLRYLQELQQLEINPIIHDTFDNPLQQLITWSLRDLNSTSIDFTPNYEDAASYAQNFCGSQMLHNLNLITEQVNELESLKLQVRAALNEARQRPHHPVVLKVKANPDKFIPTEYDDIVKLVKPLLGNEIEEIVKLFDVTALGELLIDFTENGISPQGNPLLEANPGGAPCNVLAMLAKLGKKTAFIGKIGNDMFGHQLKNCVEAAGIHTQALQMDETVHTTLAFVHTAPDGDRDFSFYRNPGADMMLTKAEVDEDCIRNSRIFHFGTLSSTHEGVREATRHALRIAKESGALVSFDPNLRPPLWNSLEDARTEIEYGLTQCDILKISDNEVTFLFDTEDYDEGARLLQEKYHIPLIFITLGPDGSRAYYNGLRVEAAPFLLENTIETTGAGDTFCACALNYILEHGIEHLTEDNLQELLTFANAAAALITTRKGALKVMPEKDEIMDLIASQN